MPEGTKGPKGYVVPLWCDYVGPKGYVVPLRTTSGGPEGRAIPHAKFVDGSIGCYAPEVQLWAVYPVCLLVVS